MDKHLILVRGIPGSGKSTFAKLLGGNHFESDMYFNKDGEYKFDPSKLKDAHEWCKDAVRTSMIWDIEKIVVSNTFSQDWEMQPYFELAKEYDYMVHVLIKENRHEGKNVHNVPEEKLEQMKNRFELKLI
jgi:predicted kinase